jgi:formylglycine-generating enzyme required for sulfatase activity
MREWTLDYHDGYPQNCDDCANLTNPTASREARGGDWNNDVDSLSSFSRIGYDPAATMSWVGFRCARRPR